MERGKYIKSGRETLAQGWGVMEMHKAASNPSQWRRREKYIIAGARSSDSPSALCQNYAPELRMMERGRPLEENAVKR